MLRFELKKVFLKSRNKITLLVLALMLIATSILTMSRVEYIDADGNRTSGIAAAQDLRVEKNEWAGYLTEDVLAEVVAENERINRSQGSLVADSEQEDRAYAQKQGMSDIVTLINSAFSEWRDYNYYAIDSVSAEEAGMVYEKRIAALKGYLDSGEESFTEAQREFLVQRYESLQTPFYYEYIDGWSALLQNISTFLLMLALVIGFLVSGIFSEEFQTKADAILFSAKLGRNQAVRAKIEAGFLITTVFYFAFVFLYTMIVLFALGFDGAGCPIQLDLWRSSYNITFLQGYFLIVCGGYIGTLFAATVSMLASAALRSTTVAVIIPFIILCAFPFLSRIVTLPQICAFFPDQLLEVYIGIKEFGLAELCGKAMSTVTVIFPAYAAACLVLLPVLYFVYRRAEAR